MDVSKTADDDGYAKHRRVVNCEQDQLIVSSDAIGLAQPQSTWTCSPPMTNA